MFMALPMLYRVVAVFLAIALVVGGWFLYYRERNNFAEYRSDVAAAVKAQQDKTNIITKQQNQVSMKAEANYAKDVASIRYVYDGLRKSNGGSAVSNIPDPAADPARATAYYVSVAPDLAEKCAITTQKWLSVVEWADEQEQVNNGR